MKKVIVALIAVGAAMSAAHAQTQTTQTAPRVYLGLGLASASHSYSINNVAITSHDTYSGNIKMFGGYEIDPLFGVEIGYIDYRNAGFNYTAFGMNGHGTSDGNAYYIAAKVRYPITEQFEVYGKLGPERSRRNLKDVGFFNQGTNSTYFYGAVGVQFNLSPQIGLLAEYERYGKTKEYGARPDAWTIGARYNF